jgi:hypothetical protein
MLSGYKTYITAILAILGAVGGYLTGDLSIAAAAPIVVQAILGMTIRNAISKSTSQ